MYIVYKYFVYIYIYTCVWRDGRTDGRMYVRTYVRIGTYRFVVEVCSIGM